MSSQEEEMRQNMEELKATQEESARREQELKGMVEAIDNFLLKAETNTEGELITGNDLFLNTFGYNKNEISEKNIESLIHKDEVAEFRKMWNKVLQGNDQAKVIKAITKENEALWLISSLTPIRDKEDNIIKVLYIGLDHTDSEKEKIKLKEQIQNNK
jgi:PAS domain S-box-containing protein